VNGVHCKNRGQEIVLLRRLAAVLAVALGVGLLTGQVASAAQVVYVGNPAVTRVYHGATIAVVGFAVPGATVVLHYHRAGTAATDYSIERSVRADPTDGFWFRESVLDVDYRVFATVGIGNPHSATLLFTSAGATPARITSTTPAQTHKPFYELFNVTGTAAPFIQVQLHYRRTSAPTVDIARTVFTDQTGSWSRTAVLDSSYTVFATIGLGNPHSATVGYFGHDATVGDILDVDFSPSSGSPNTVLTVLGAQFASYTDPVVGGATPPAGKRYTQAHVCVRNRGPQVFSDDPTGSFDLIDTVGSNPAISPEAFAQGEAPVNLSSMQVGELRCGALLFAVPLGSAYDQLGYAPGLVPNHYQVRWTLPVPAPVTTSVAGPTALPQATRTATQRAAVRPQPDVAGPVQPAAR